MPRKLSPWASDAADIQVGDRLPDIIYQNQTVVRFLEDPKKYIISAGKGMGKTLLLTYKRYQLDKEYSTGGGGSSVQFVPTNTPYLDCMPNLPSLSKEWVRALGSIDDAEKLWLLAFQISALTHARSDADKSYRSRLPGDLPEFLRSGSRVTPTLAAHIMMQLSVSEFHRLYDRFRHHIAAEIQSMHSALFYFVDKVDQASSNLPRPAWVGIQVGLALATMNIRNFNSHHKAFTSVRQEAYSNAESDRRANLSGAVSEIRYEPRELNDMMDQLSRCYENEHTFERFVGFRSVHNNRADRTEGIYPYLFRHTIGRPRDLVRIAEHLSAARGLDEESFKAIVNRVGSEIISQEVFAEVKVFLECLRRRDDRSAFLQRIGSNILRRCDIERICEEVNGISPIVDYDMQGLHHPFCELYSAGLLGVLKPGNEAGESILEFRQPHDRFLATGRDLPSSPYYFVHPGLQHAMKDLTDYRVLRFVAVGHGYPWNDRSRALVEAQLELERLTQSPPPDLTVRLDNGFRDRVMRALAISHGRGETLTTDRRAVVQAEMGADWQRLTEDCETDAALTNLYLWVDAAVCGGLD